MKIRIHKVHLGRSTYRNAYLKSEEWAAIRERIIRRAPEGLCEKCKRVPPTDVHHMDYRVLALPGFETRDQLIALCRPCHDMVEEAKKLKLIPDTHQRAHIYRLTEEAVKAARAERKRKFIWDQRLCDLMALADTHGQRLVCGALKMRPPEKRDSWLGMKITRAKKEQIEGILAHQLGKYEDTRRESWKLKHKIQDRKNAICKNWKVGNEHRPHFKRGVRISNKPIID